MPTRTFRRRSLAEARAAADAVVSGVPVDTLLTKRRAPRKNVEEQHGIALMQWAARAEKRRPELRWLHHIPNGGGRSKAEAGRMKAQGVRKGVLDYFLPVCTVRFVDRGKEYVGVKLPGLYVELKADGLQGKARGGMSQDQVDFATFVDGQDFVVCLCYDWHQAKEAIEAYLDLKPIPHRWSPPA